MVNTSLSVHRRTEFVATFDGVRWALADPQAVRVTVRSPMPMAVAIPVRHWSSLDSVLKLRRACPQHLADHLLRHPQLAADRLDRLTLNEIGATDLPNRCGCPGGLHGRNPGASCTPEPSRRGPLLLGIRRQRIARSCAIHLEASVSTIMSQSLDCRRSAGIAAAGLSSSAPAATNAACTAVRFDRRKDRVGASSSAQ